MKRIIYSVFAMALSVCTFTSCEDVPMPYSMNFEEKTNNPSDNTELIAMGSGTENDPFNVVAAQKYIEAGIDLDKVVYVKGIVSNIKEIDDTNFGNATYYISEDGSEKNQFLVYRGYALGNVKFTASNKIKKGDQVIVCGKLINFNGTKEFTQGNYIYSLNGKKGEEKVSTDLNTANTAFTVAQALQKINENGGKPLSGDAYVKGIISEVTSYNDTYKSITYYISDNGQDKALQVFSGKGLNGADFNAKDNLKAGQKVIVKGKLMAYTNKAGVTSNQFDKNSIIISIEDASNPATQVGLNATFAESMDNFTIVNVKPLPADLEYIWKHDAKNKYMKASAYKNQTNYEAQSRIVSPAFSLSGKTTATLKFEHTGKYFGDVAMADAIKVYASKNGKDWTQLTINTFPTGNDWNFVQTTCDMNLFAGQPTVYLAFEYNSTSTAAATWEIKNIVVE